VRIVFSTAIATNVNAVDLSMFLSTFFKGVVNGWVVFVFSDAV
jgi:hypothetical protein